MLNSIHSLRPLPCHHPPVLDLSQAKLLDKYKDLNSFPGSPRVSGNFRGKSLAHAWNRLFLKPPKKTSYSGTRGGGACVGYAIAALLKHVLTNAYFCVLSPTSAFDTMIWTLWHNDLNSSTQWSELFDTMIWTLRHNDLNSLTQWFELFDTMIWTLWHNDLNSSTQWSELFDTMIWTQKTTV